MKPALAMLLIPIFSFGCGDNTPATPPDDTTGEGVNTLDGPYLVSVALTSSTCGETITDAPTLGLVDVFLRTDGTVNLTSKLNVPMPMTYRNVAVGPDGAVAFQWTSMSAYGDFPQSANGTLTTSRIALDFASDDIDFAGEAQCHRTFSIMGSPTRMHDRLAIDGYHQVALTLTQPWCPDKPGTPKAAGTALMTIVSTDETHALISLGTWMNAVVPMPSQGGTLEWQGTGIVGGVFGDEEIDTHGSGRIDRTATKLTFTVPDSADTACGYKFEAVGARRVPSSKSVANDYAMVFDWTDSCKTAGHSEGPVTLITVADGSLMLDEGSYAPTILKKSDDGTFDSQEGSEADHWILRYKATVAPPNLTYEVSERYVDPTSGDWCDLQATATGVARYLNPGPTATKTSALRIKGAPSAASEEPSIPWKAPKH